MGRKLGTLLIGIAVLATIPVSALGFTLNAFQLQSFYEISENPIWDPGTDLFAVQALPNGAKYVGNIGLDQSGWSQIQIGANFWGQPYGGAAGAEATLADLGLGSLFGQTNLTQQITNLNENAWTYNLFFNVGYTDWGETDYYIQNTWTQVGAGASSVFALDFSNAQVWGGAYSGDWVDLSSIGFDWDHISSIGLNIGGNVPLGHSADDYTFETVISPVPEPGTLLLLGSGLLGLGYLRRRK